MSRHSLYAVLFGLILMLGTNSRAISMPCAICDSLCGPRSLLAACRALKIDASLDELVALSGKAGTESALDRLIPAVKKKGLAFAKARISSDELSKMDIDCLAMLWGNHIVYVHADGQGGLEIENPLPGSVSMSMDEFKNEFTGMVLFISTDAKSLPADRTTTGPVLVPGWYVTDFGDVDHGKILEETVELTNAGTSDLVITNARTTCGCASTVLSGEVVHPGEHTSVRVTINTSGRQGMQYYRLYIRSNDPVTPIAQLGIIGTVVLPNVAVYPETVDLGSTRHGECDFREIYVYDSGGRDFRVTKAESDSPYISCFPASISDRKHPRFIVVAGLSPDAPVGKLIANVIVTTTHPKNPVVRIPIQVEIKAEEETPTKCVYLGVVPKGRGAECTVEISSSSALPLKVECAENQVKNVSVEILPKDLRRCAAVVKLDDKTPADTVVRGSITLRTNDPKQPEIRLCVYGRVISSDSMW